MGFKLWTSDNTLQTVEARTSCSLQLTCILFYFQYANWHGNENSAQLCLPCDKLCISVCSVEPVSWLILWCCLVLELDKGAAERDAKSLSPSQSFYETMKQCLDEFVKTDRILLQHLNSHCRLSQSVTWLVCYVTYTCVCGKEYCNNNVVIANNHVFGLNVCLSMHTCTDIHADLKT